MSNKNNIPAIRFRGFDEEWEKCVMSELANFSKGQGYSKGDLRETGVPIVLYGRLYTKYEVVISNPDTFAENSANAILSKGGEVVVPASGETTEDIARASAIADIGIILGGDLNILSPNNNVESVFLALSISYGNIHRILSSKAQGKSVVHLRNDDIKPIEIQIPNIVEQQQIGHYFQSLDKLISEGAQKLEKLKQLKAAYLEKMFPRNGATVPEIRFRGFSGEWEERKVGEFCSVTIGEFVIQTKQRDDAPFPVYNGGISYTGFYNEYNNEGKKIIISARGANAGFVNKSDGKYWAGNSCYSVGVKDDTYWIFLFYIIKNKELEFKQAQQSANIPSVSKKQVEELSVLLPLTEEQTKIGNFFQNIDEQIAKQNEKQNKLKNIKTACLDKMFA